MVTTYGQALFYLTWTARILSLSPRGIFPWKGLARLLLLSALPLPLLLLLRLAGLSPLPDLAAGALLYFPFVAMLLWRYGPLSETDRALIRRLWGRFRPNRS